MHFISLFSTASAHSASPIPRIVSAFFFFFVIMHISLVSFFSDFGVYSDSFSFHSGHSLANLAHTWRIGRTGEPHGRCYVMIASPLFLSFILGHGHGMEYIWITGFFVLGGWFICLSVWARIRKRLRLRLRYGYRYGEMVMAHIGTDCIACIALRCAALHLHLLLQLGMDLGMLSLLIFLQPYRFWDWFGFLDLVMMDMWYVGM